MRVFFSIVKVVLLLVGLSLPLVSGLRAQTAISIKCDLCGKLFATDGRVMRDSVRNRDRTVCQSCAQLPTHCAVCNLPVPEKNPLKIPDGRTYCQLDAPTLVMEQREANQHFHEAKRDVFRQLADWPPLPDASVTFALVDKDEFLRQFARFPTAHDPAQVLGLTRTFFQRDGTRLHAIFVLNGLTPAQFVSTCAHELAHAWLNERLRKERQIHGDTAEGFCELVAWRVMSERHEAAELKRIEASSYTHGQFGTLLSAEKEYRFYRIVEWIDNGLDAWLDPQKQDRVLALRDVRPVAAEQTQRASVVHTVSVRPTAPDRLMLKGILGAAPSSRLALINDGTFARGDRLKVRLGDGKVEVECLEIRDQSVLLVVGASRERQELFLKKK